MKEFEDYEIWMEGGVEYKMVPDECQIPTDWARVFYTQLGYNTKTKALCEVPMSIAMRDDDIDQRFRIINHWNHEAQINFSEHGIIWKYWMD